MCLAAVLILQMLKLSTVPSSRIKITSPEKRSFPGIFCGFFSRYIYNHSWVCGTILEDLFDECSFNCGYHAQSRTTVCTHNSKECLHTMLCCPHCDHHVWSTDAWVKHVYTHHSQAPNVHWNEARTCNTCRICRSLGGTCNFPRPTRYKCSKVKNISLTCYVSGRYSKSIHFNPNIYPKYIPLKLLNVFLQDVAAASIVTLKSNDMLDSFLFFVLFFTFSIILNIGWSQMASLAISLVTSSF